MANVVIHEEQAKHNYNFLKKLQKEGGYHDWQITIAFYTALHIVDCELMKSKPDWRKLYTQGSEAQVGWHAVRQQCINSMYRDIYKNYRLLYEKSQLVRYLEGINKKAVDEISKEDAKNYIDTNLGAILTRFSYPL